MRLHQRQRRRPRPNTKAAVSCRATATIPVGAAPIGAAANRKTNTIYVTNADSNMVSVINGPTNTVVATIHVGAFPYGVA